MAVECFMYTVEPYFDYAQNKKNKKNVFWLLFIYNTTNLLYFRRWMSPKASGVVVRTAMGVWRNGKSFAPSKDKTKKDRR